MPNGCYSRLGETMEGREKKAEAAGGTRLGRLRVAVWERPDSIKRGI